MVPGPWLATVLFAIASPASAEGIDERINSAVQPAADFVSGLVFSTFPVAGIDVPFVLLWLMVAATFFTIYFRFINFRALRHGFQLLRGDYSDPMAAGEVTHFQALATALSGTVGLGNIAGVAVAVSIGGPGATFWMIAAGLLGMSSKFVECTLGVKYRNEYTDGTVSGGPMYYLSKGLAERGGRYRVLGRFLAVLFAIFCVGASIGGGNMFQANQSFMQLVAATGGESSWLQGQGWLYGIILALIVGLIVLGGIQGIARMTSACCSRVSSARHFRTRPVSVRRRSRTRPCARPGRSPRGWWPSTNRWSTRCSSARSPRWSSSLRVPGTPRWIRPRAWR